MIRNPSNNISVLLLINSSPTRLMCRLISLGASVCWTIMAGPPPTIAARTGQTKVRNGKFLDILLSISKSLCNDRKGWNLAGHNSTGLDRIETAWYAFNQCTCCLDPNWLSNPLTSDVQVSRLQLAVEPPDRQLPPTQSSNTTVLPSLFCHLSMYLCTYL